MPAAGGIIATKQEIRAYPTRTNQIPRHIPPPHWASHPAVLCLAAGLLPFGTIFVELYFAMTSIWQARRPPIPVLRGLLGFVAGRLQSALRAWGLIVGARVHASLCALSSGATKSSDTD